MNGFVAVDGHPPGETLAYFLKVSPRWIDTLKIPFMDGRDFRASDTSPGVAIVNQAFVKEYFHGENPIGKSFEKTYDHLRFQVVGVVRDARYRNMREPITPTAYIPLHSAKADGSLAAISRATLLVRTSNSNPLTLVSMLRRE